MVDLDSNPTKLIEVVEIGKQLLITRGLADDVLDRQRRRQVLRDHPGDVRRRAAGARPDQRDGPGLAALGDPRAVIFNALIIVALIPLALRGVQVPGRVGGGGAAPQPARLRRRRDHRPVRRHQAHRHRHLGPGGLLT